MFCANSSETPPQNYLLKLEEGGLTVKWRLHAVENDLTEQCIKCLAPVVQRFNVIQILGYQNVLVSQI